MTNYLDAAPCGYFAFSDQGEILRVNTTLCRLLGYTKEELLTQKLEVIFPVATKIFHQTHFFPLLKMHGHAEEIFIFLLAKNGRQVPVLMNASREEIDGIDSNNCACIVVQNRKKFEDELVNAKNRAESALKENKALMLAKEALTKESEKLDGQIRLVKKQNLQLAQLNRVATHNLQEPVRKILVFANMFSEKTRDLEQRENLFQRLVKSANVMRETLAGLQQYIWLNELALNSSPVNVGEIILDVKEKLNTEFPRESLELNQEEFPVISGNKDQLHLLFYHLLLNSIHFKKPATTVKVVIKATQLKLNNFKFVDEKYAYGDYLRIDIEDDGLGFDPIFKDQVFELFKKLHHLDRKGLGLSFCKAIVENHQGTIEADSTPGVGTRITITLPISAAE